MVDVRSTLAGQARPGEIEIRENGLLFEVDLTLGQKGGLFLDQRDNRQRVRELAQGRRVLNLFGYTGGFSVYAAAGGAESTTTVDSAAGAISAARRNFDRNHLPNGRGRVRGRRCVRVSDRGREEHRALGSGDFGSTQLCSQPSGRAGGPARLSAPAPTVRGRHRTGWDALRCFVLQPRRRGRVSAFRRGGVRRRRPAF